MDLIARRSLIRPAESIDSPALLWEGDWPTGWQHPERLSLDRLIDARWSHLDADACSLVEELRISAAWSPPGKVLPQHAEQQTSGALLADIFALRLRYYVLKLLRFVAALEHEPRLQPVRRGRLIVASQGDEDLVALAQAWAARRQIALAVERRSGAVPPARPLPENQLWRRSLATAASWLDPRSARSSSRRPAILLCGNPTHLRPVAWALRESGYSVVWLYERFALRAWLTDSLRQDRQRWCESIEGGARCSDLGFQVPELSWRGVPLGPAIHAGFLKGAGALWHWAHRREQCVARLIQEELPQAVILNEDATPFARTVIRAAQRRRVATFVVQHGAPYVRFGFAPPAADRLLVWGPGTQTRLVSWGVPRERIITVGCPWWTAPVQRPPATPQHARPAFQAQQSPLRVLLLGTVPPRDDRPDAVSFHLTSNTYRRMLQLVAEVLSDLPGVLLRVRPHPRGQQDEALRQVLEPCLAGRVQWFFRGSLNRCLKQTDCVLSCASSAGVEAAAAGLPVIQLLPEGSEDACSGPDWGFVGNARTTSELRRLMEQVRSGAWYGMRSEGDRALLARGADAARRVVRAVEQMTRAAPPHGSRTESPACPELRQSSCPPLATGRAS